jgi:putative DNA primase/helicase
MYLNREARSRMRLIRTHMRRDMPVVPLQQRGKKPITGYGSRSPIVTLRQAHTVFLAQPELNYGVVTGSVSRLLVIDVDGEPGKRSLRKLVKANGPLPKTVKVLTGRGYHLLYEIPNGVSVRNAKLGDGLDIKGDGGYVVGPGSIHPNGSRYQYAPGRHIWEQKIAEIPEWLLNRVVGPSPQPPHTLPQPVSAEHDQRARAYANAARERELERLAKAPKHQRNDTLNRCAFRLGQLAAWGLLDVSRIKKELAQVARQIGLDRRRSPRPFSAD